MTTTASPASWSRAPSSFSTAFPFRQVRRFEYPFSPAGVVDFFREYYGPTNRAFAALTTHDQEALHADLVALWSAHNHSSLANRTAVDAEYLEVVAIRSTQ